jgi:flagellar assembly factor FliW
VIVLESEYKVRGGQEEVLPPLSALGSLQFAEGLLGFEAFRRAELISLADAGPYCWLKFEGVNQRGFLVVQPSCVAAPYRIEIGAKVCEELGLNRPADAEVLNIVTIRPDGTLTINLKGPIVYNKVTREARQVVPLNASELPVNFPIGN